ncbi:ladderlectin [Hemibagrus wyckioides]|nr:ladderlectin [Hemibagrus wyckioides]
MKILIVFVLLTLAFSACDAKSPGLKKCSEGWTGFGRKCYTYVAEVKPWAEAERYCQALGGNLASIHSNQTQALLKKMGKISGSYKRTWIGAQDATQNSVWLWSDGSVFDFSLWHSGEPNHGRGGREHCVEMNYGVEVLWNDAQCSTNLYFLCQKPAHTPPICRI